MSDHPQNNSQEDPQNGNQLALVPVIPSPQPLQSQTFPNHELALHSSSYGTMGYKVYPSQLATHGEVVANGNLFLDTLNKFHATLGTKFIIYCPKLWHGGLVLCLACGIRQLVVMSSRTRTVIQHAPNVVSNAIAGYFLGAGMGPVPMAWASFTHLCIWGMKIGPDANWFRPLEVKSWICIFCMWRLLLEVDWNSDKSLRFYFIVIPFDGFVKHP
eukprot:Gb_18464 [translate_table: standard]